MFNEFYDNTCVMCESMSMIMRCRRLGHHSVNDGKDLLKGPTWTTKRFARSSFLRCSFSLAALEASCFSYQACDDHKRLGKELDGGLETNLSTIPHLCDQDGSLPFGHVFQPLFGAT